MSRDAIMRHKVRTEEQEIEKFKKKTTTGKASR